MIDLFVILILVIIIGGALTYIMSSRKKGITCIGCAQAKSCSSNTNCDSNPLYDAYYGK